MREPLQEHRCAHEIWHPSAVLDVEALRLGPLTNRCGVGSTGMSSPAPAAAWPPSGRTRCPARSLDVGLQRLSECLSVLGVQVDLMEAIDPRLADRLAKTGVRVTVARSPADPPRHRAE